MSKPCTNCRISKEQDSAVPSNLPGEPQLVWGEKVQSRRELFTTVLRYATLGTLAAIGGAVFAKRRRLVQNGICINREICQSCRIFKECDLPAALSAKTNVNENR